MLRKYNKYMFACGVESHKDAKYSYIIKFNCSKKCGVCKDTILPEVRSLPPLS